MVRGGGGGGGGAPWRRRFRGEGTRRMERIATTAITSRSAVWYRAAEAVLVATSSAPPVERAARIRATTAFRRRGRRSRAPHAVLSRLSLPGEATSDARRRFDRFGRDMRACVLGAHSRPFVFRSMAYTLIPSFISPGSDLLGRVAALARVPAPHSALRRAARRVRGVRGSTHHFSSSRVARHPHHHRVCHAHHQRHRRVMTPSLHCMWCCRGGRSEGGVACVRTPSCRAYHPLAVPRDDLQWWRGMRRGEERRAERILRGEEWSGEYAERGEERRGEERSGEEWRDHVTSRRRRVERVGRHPSTDDAAPRVTTSSPGTSFITSSRCASTLWAAMTR